MKQQSSTMSIKTRNLRHHVDSELPQSFQRSALLLPVPLSQFNPSLCTEPNNIISRIHPQVYTYHILSTPPTRKWALNFNSSVHTEEPTESSSATSFRGVSCSCGVRHRVYTGGTGSRPRSHSVIEESSALSRPSVRTKNDGCPGLILYLRGCTKPSRIDN